MLGTFLCRSIVALAALAPGMMQADVFDMGGTRNADGSWTGLASLHVVPVGNLGNTDDDNGFGAVGYAYNIGKYEVTAAQYTEFLNAVAKTSDPYGLYNTWMWSSDYGCKIQRTLSSGIYTYSVAADRANRPVNYVSWGDAARFANWLHNGQPTGPQGPSTTEDGAYYLNGAVSDAALMAVNREADWKWAIPTEDEWYKAAYHKNDGDTGNYFDYPTRNNSEPSNDLLNPDPGNNANFWQDGYTIDSPYYTTVVGDFENSESPYDTFDQGGNLWEWNEAEFYGGSRRGLRGGFCYGYSYSLAASRHYVLYPAQENDTVGFRVVSVPEPGSITLLLFGAIAAMKRRKRRR